MKKFIIILLLFPLFTKAQDSTIVTNLNLKAGTIRLLIGSISINELSARPFIKWADAFTNAPPENDNANVNIDTIKTELIVQCYAALLSMPAGLTEGNDFIGDFKTSIQSKRNTNSYLDGLCEDLETGYAATFEGIKQRGNIILTGN